MNKKNDLYFTDSKFNPSQFWYHPILDSDIDEKFIRSSECVKTFDQNGYELSPLEQIYAKYNCDVGMTIHRDVRVAIFKPWFYQKSLSSELSNESQSFSFTDKLSGYVLNHSMLLERKGYDGQALEQLKDFARVNPLIYKLINYKTKWGIDFSLDYVDYEGNCMEIFHYEYDSFNFDKILVAKKEIEKLVMNTDFDLVAQDLLKRKDEWFNLEFFDQSKWKTDYFGLEPERFKMVGWQ